MVRCEACGKKEEELGGLMMMRCARCFNATYCDGECQKAHWAAHRAACKERAAAIAASDAKPIPLIGVDPGFNATALRRIADAGDAGAMAHLGLCYQFGKGGVGVDAAEAVRWYTRAVEARNPPAEAYVNLANCYCRSEGVLKNLPEAARLYRIAAEKGSPFAQYRLGTCLQHGEGVPYNPVEAFKWLKRAADAGDVNAQCEVGYALRNGLGVPEDKAAGVVYYRRAADQGDANAMFNLGDCHGFGDGVPRDMPQAVAWLTRARNAGDPDAARVLTEIAPHLTPSQRAAADQLLATPRPRPPAPIGKRLIFAPTGIAGGASAPPPTRAEVLAMGTAALKRLLQSREVDTSGIVEKARLIELALAVIGAAPQ